MEKQKHIILRREIVSRKMYPSNELIRIVKNKDGEVFVDSTKKANGRGLYIAPNLKSVEIAENKKLISKVFKMQIPDELFDELKKEIETNWD